MSDTIRKRIQGRELAKALLALADKNDLADIHVEEGFYRELRDVAAAALGENKGSIVIEPMNDNEARRFENDRIDFAQFAGEQFSKIPFSYIALFIRTGVRFLRYAKSDRAKNRSDWEETF